MLTEKVSKLAVIAKIVIGIVIAFRFLVDKINWSPIQNSKILEINVDHCKRMLTIQFPNVNPMIGKTMCKIAVHKASKNRCFTAGSNK